MVYVEASQIRFSCMYCPLISISTYEASKLDCEALIMSCTRTFNHNAVILRLANAVEPRSDYGVIIDMIIKTMSNPIELEILDVTQRKSYIFRRAHQGNDSPIKD